MKSGLSLEIRPGIVLAHSPGFRLGSAEVRPATRELIGPVAREVIEPRVMQVLVALAGAKGDILSRDDLISLCWDGRLVGEDAINRVLSKLRKLGDSVAGGSFGVETITKVGYRLLVREAGEAVASPITAPLSAPPKMNRRALLAGAGAMLALGGGAGWLATRDRDGIPAEAEPFYAQGMAALRIGLSENNAQAIGFLRRAAELAPQSAQVWGALAVAYQQSRNSLPPAEANTAQERARSAVRRALELSPDNATAHAARALDMPLFGNWAAVEQATRRALALDPRQFDAGGMLAFLLWNVGRTREALAGFDRVQDAVAMLPLPQYRLGMLLWSVGRLDEADRVLDRAMSLWPRNYVIWFTRFWLHARTGRTQEALAMSANRAVRPPGVPEWNFEVNDLTARALGSRAPADIQNARAANFKAAPMGAGFAENAIQFAAPIGLLDDAFRIARAYYFGSGFAVGPARFTAQQGGYTPRDRRITHILFAPTTRAMRQDARFLPLVRELGLIDYWRRTGTRPDTAAEMRLPV